MQELHPSAGPGEKWQGLLLCAIPAGIFAPRLRPATYPVIPCQGPGLDSDFRGRWRRGSPLAQAGCMGGQQRSASCAFPGWLHRSWLRVFAVPTFWTPTQLGVVPRGAGPPSAFTNWVQLGEGAFLFQGSPNRPSLPHFRAPPQRRDRSHPSGTGGKATIILHLSGGTILM